MKRVDLGQGREIMSHTRGSQYNHADDLALLGQYFDRNLPVLVLNCGSGASAAVLSEIYEQVIATDRFPTIVKQAKQNFSNDALIFRQLDLMDSFDIKELAEEFGPMNIYWVGSIQQIMQDQRKQLIKQIKTLLGKEGRMFFMELSPNTSTYLENLEFELGMLDTNVTAALMKKVTEIVGVGKLELKKTFSGKNFKILESKMRKVDLHIRNRDSLQVPVHYVILRNK